MKTLFRSLAYFKQDSPRLGAVLALMVASIGFNLLKPWPLALIVDSVLGHKPLPAWVTNFFPATAGPAEWLIGLSVAILLLHLGQGALSTVQNYLAISIGLRGLQRVRDEVYACLQRLSLRFHHGSKSGDLIYRASWDTYSFQTLFQQGTITFASAILSLVLMVIVMVRLNLSLTLVAIATIPLLALAIRIFGKKMTERGNAAQQADSQVTSLVQQSIAALPLIQSYAREDMEQKKFTVQTATAQDARLSQHGWELVYWLAITVVFGLGTAAIVWFGGRQVMSGQLSIGELLIFLTYLSQLYDPLNQLSHVGATISTASAGAARVFELLDTPEEVKDMPGARGVVKASAKTGEQGASGPVQARGNIEFSHVSFGYQSGQTVLRDVSFTLHPGKCAAVIGPSGVGKSTLMNLLPRFFDPSEGIVRLEGTDLKTLRLHDLRSQIAVVLQEPILLPATLAENIAYGRPNATPAEIEAAARAANAHDFIQKLPKKYDTQVGDGAVRLSVGERQRINIARAFLKDAPILLLDEPTSALDSESEAQVVSSLFSLMKGRTTLMVAHRLTTIRKVDQVIVLLEGGVTEAGTPEELLAKGGYYARVTAGQVELD